jgi:ribosome-associated translation inhibitor RaiA
MLSLRERLFWKPNGIEQDKLVTNALSRADDMYISIVDSINKLKSNINKLEQLISAYDEYTGPKKE